MNIIDAVNTIELVCIDEKIGRKIDIKSNSANKFRQACESARGGKGKVLYKEDWIDPSSRWVCKSTPLTSGELPKIYYSKKECNKAQLKDKSVVYKKISKVPPFEPIEKQYKVHPLIRKWSRINILIITFLSMVITYLIWLFFFSKNNKIEQKYFNDYFKKYIYFILIFILTIGLLTFFFCPLNLCYLDKDSSEIRKNLPAYIHTKFCNLNDIFGVQFPGCTDSINVCDITRGIYPGCWW